MKNGIILLLLVSFCACGDANNTVPYTKERAIVNPEAVLTYTESDNGDTAKTLRVALFEQKESLKFEVKFSYKDATGEKIFSYPNLGFMPKPGLKKGPKPMSCIIGFYDADSVFMDLRLVAVENGSLYYRHLKEYQVEAEK